MEYEQALEIGQTRAEVAAEIIRRWTGVKACAVCAVKQAASSDQRATENWQPVGERSYKEIARDDGMRGQGNYHLIVVDKSGSAKACTMARFALCEVLRLADRLPISVAAPGEGDLWRCLEEKRSWGPAVSPANIVERH